MRTVLKVVLGVVLLATTVVLALAFTRPDRFEVVRRTTIAAPPDRVFALVNDLHAFNRWSPWVRMEPDVALRYSGPASGPGAAFAWEGDKTGAGSMAIRAATPPSRVEMDLHFLKPFDSRSSVDFGLAPEGAGTAVSWAMRGPMPFISKLMSVFFDMDAMIGPDFERGLANLKALAEGG